MAQTLGAINLSSVGDTPTHILARNSFKLFCSILFINIAFHCVEAGLCWAGPNQNGRCTDLLRSGVTEEECCKGVDTSNNGITSTAYSDDLTSGQLFYYRALRGGVACSACKVTCEGVECGPHKKCVLKDEGHQRACICAPKCSRRKRRRGPVCGSDGHTYRHFCRLQKRKCRKDSSLTVEYYGSCQNSCESVRCADKKTCLLDNARRPRCVRCKGHCRAMISLGARGGQPCGPNNVTRPCHSSKKANWAKHKNVYVSAVSASVGHRNGTFSTMSSEMIQQIHPPS